MSTYSECQYFDVSISQTDTATHCRRMFNDYMIANTPECQLVKESRKYLAVTTKSMVCFALSRHQPIISVVTVIETDTETAVFLQNRTEPKPRFYASD